jgi:hypothetical protein
MASFSKPSVATDGLDGDAWDMLLSPSSSSATPPTLRSAATSSSSSSGEYNAFSFVCSVLAGGDGNGGGGSGGNRLFLLTSESEECLGGISGSKFCLKTCVDGKSCGIATHANRKARLPVDFLFVMENYTKAFCEPQFDASGLAEEQLAKLLSLSHTKSEWAEIFNELEQGVLPSFLSVGQALTGNEEANIKEATDSGENEPEARENLQMELKSPKSAADQTGFFSIFPMLSYEDTADEEDMEDQDVSPGQAKDEVTAHLRSSVIVFHDLKTSGHRLFRMLKRASARYI